MLSVTKFPILMVVLSISIFFISACDSKPPKSKIENPLAGHVDALEKAKNVEKQLLDAQQRAQDTIDKASQ